MSNLRSAVIRLAHQNPSLRAHLLPLVKQARGEMDTLIENDKVRVTWADHPDNRMEVQEMPGKPVKRRLRKRTYNTGQYVQWFHPGSAFLMENIKNDAKLSSGMGFDQVVSAMDKALEDAKDRLIAESLELVEKYPREKYPHAAYQVYSEADFTKLGFPRSIVWNDEVSFLEVEPANYKPVQFRGKDFGGTAKWNEFKFYADKDDDEFMRQTEGMQAFYKSLSAGGARKLFKLLKADPEAVKAMNESQFKDFLNRNKIGYDYVPTVWR